MASGKAAGKGKIFEKWKLFLGHLALDVDRWQIETFVTQAVGVKPFDIHMQYCDAAKRKGKGKQMFGTEVGLNACFIEFRTLGRL